MYYEDQKANGEVLLEAFGNKDICIQNNNKSRSERNLSLLFGYSPCKNSSNSKIFTSLNIDSNHNNFSI